MQRLLLLLLLESRLGSVQGELALERCPGGSEPGAYGVKQHEHSSGRFLPLPGLGHILGGSSPASPLSLMALSASLRSRELPTLGWQEQPPLSAGGESWLPCLSSGTGTEHCLAARNKLNPQSITGDSPSWLFPEPQDSGLHRASLA